MMIHTSVLYAFPLLFDSPDDGPEGRNIYIYGEVICNNSICKLSASAFVSYQRKSMGIYSFICYINMDLKEMRWTSVDWVYLQQKRENETLLLIGQRTFVFDKLWGVS
jgi:hypothetical protein